MSSRVAGASIIVVLGCSSTSAPADAGGDSTVAPDGAACCGEDVNAGASLFAEPYLGSATWMAWVYTPVCGPLGASRLEMPTDAPAVAVLADDNGQPGAVLLAETATTPLGPRQVSATFAALDLVKGKSIWIAIKHKIPGSITSGTITPMAMSGIATPKAFSDNLAGPWKVAGTAAFVFVVSCK